MRKRLYRIGYVGRVRSARRFPEGLGPDTGQQMSLHGTAPGATANLPTEHVISCYQLTTPQLWCSDETFKSLRQPFSRHFFSHRTYHRRSDKTLYFSRRLAGNEITASLSTV